MTSLVNPTAVVAGGGTVNKLRAYIELGKLRLSSLAIFAVLAGLYLGLPWGASPTWGVVLGLTVGTLLVAMAGNALNMHAERDADERMERTRARPLPTGRLSPGEVQAFGFGLAILGLALLALTTNLLATGICAAIFVTYVGIYTPMKRVSSLNTLIGAVPGALPPVVGYAAGAGMVDARAGVLFLILFLWQIPHFLAISWHYRDDYARGGMRMLSVVDPDGVRTGQQILLYLAALIVVTLLPFGLRMAGPVYLAVALFLNVLFLAPAVMAGLLRWQSAFRPVFFASIIYLPILLTTLVLDRLP